MLKLAFKRWIRMSMGTMVAVAVSAISYYFLVAPEDIALAIAIAAMIILYVLSPLILA